MKSTLSIISNSISLLLLIFGIFFVAGCKKESLHTSPIEKSELIFNPNKELINTTQSLFNTTTQPIDHNWEWQVKVWAFYNFTEGGITANVPDGSLQHLGDLIDANDYQTAYSLYGIPESDLIQLKQLYVNAFSYWYDNIYNSGQAVSRSYEDQNLKKDKKITIGPAKYMDDDCANIRAGCTSDANTSYLLRMTECYGAAIAVGTFVPVVGPVLGGAVMLGCGLMVGRTRTKNIAACNSAYNICIR